MKNTTVNAGFSKNSEYHVWSCNFLCKEFYTLTKTAFTTKEGICTPQYISYLHRVHSLNSASVHHSPEQKLTFERY